MTNTTQSLKSALDARVRLDQAGRLSSQRQNLGEGLMCPAGAANIQFDIYGRPANQKTLLLNDSACSHYTEWSAQRRIEVENMERPYLPVCAAGLRGAADWMGKGRDILPQNLYGEGYSGNFVRHYNTANNAPWAQEPSNMQMDYYQKDIQPFDFSHDASSFTYRG